MNTENINITGQSFIDASVALNEIGNTINECIENIKNDMEKLNSKNMVSSIRLEKSCNYVGKVGNSCLAIGDIAKDFGSAYDTIDEPSMGRSL